MTKTILHLSNAYSQMMKNFCGYSPHKWNCYDYSNTTELVVDYYDDVDDDDDDDDDEDDEGSDDAKLDNFQWAKSSFGLMKLLQGSIEHNFAIDDKMSLVQFDADEDDYDSCDDDDDDDVDFEDDLMKYWRSYLG